MGDRTTKQFRNLELKTLKLSSAHHNLSIAEIGDSSDRDALGGHMSINSNSNGVQRQACDNACPSLETIEATQCQNWGCLPSPFEINQMLKERKIWMCHSNPTVPCVATGFDAVPEGFTVISE